MFNNFFQWLGNKIKNAEGSELEDDESAYGKTPKLNKVKYGTSITSVSAGYPRIDNDRESLVTEPVTFKMFRASGGWAIEFRRYDHKTDRQDTSLYVVPNDEELGNHISKIITMEALKR